MGFLQAQARNFPRRRVRLVFKTPAVERVALEPALLGRYYWVDPRRLAGRQPRRALFVLSMTIRPQPGSADFQLVARTFLSGTGLPFGAVLSATEVEAVFQAQRVSSAAPTARCTPRRWYCGHSTGRSWPRGSCGAVRRRSTTEGKLTSVPRPGPAGCRNPRPGGRGRAPPAATPPCRGRPRGTARPTRLVPARTAPPPSCHWTVPR